MARLEIFLGAFFSIAWVVAMAVKVGLLPLAGSALVGLYPLYSSAAALSWLAGNVYIVRRRQVKASSRRLLLLYWLGPPAITYLLRALAPVELQRAAPLIPILCFAIHTVFFLVPVSFELGRPARRRPRRPGSSGD